jgi:hypothetical protein
MDHEILASLFVRLAAWVREVSRVDQNVSVN